jgi:hypothetical protein
MSTSHFVEERAQHNGRRRPPLDHAERLDLLDRRARTMRAMAATIGAPTTNVRSRPRASTSTSEVVLAMQRSAGNAATAAHISMQRRCCDPSCTCGHDSRTVQRDDKGALEALDRAHGRPPKPSAGAPCLPAATKQPAWMPAVPARLPITLGKGTRRAPKLKAPDGPDQPKCRGACGPGCADTCNTVGTYTESFTRGPCTYEIEFPNALQCGTHAGCRTHDTCFDAAVASGETQKFGPRHNECNQDAVFRWGRKNTTSWMSGGGPYDAWWYFVDPPIIRTSKRLPGGGHGGAAPSFDLGSWLRRWF